MLTKIRDLTITKLKFGCEMKKLLTVLVFLNFIFISCGKSNDENKIINDNDVEIFDINESVNDDSDGKQIFPSKTGIYVVKSIDPDSPYDDLFPLKQIIKESPIVALGESVHTSGGF